MCRYLSVACKKGHTLTLKHSKIECNKPGSADCTTGPEVLEGQPDAITHCLALAPGDGGKIECSGYMEQYALSMLRVHKLQTKKKTCLSFSGPLSEFEGGKRSSEQIGDRGSDGDNDDHTVIETYEIIDGERVITHKIKVPAIERHETGSGSTTETQGAAQKTTQPSPPALFKEWHQEDPRLRYD